MQAFQIISPAKAATPTWVSPTLVSSMDSIVRHLPPFHGVLMEMTIMTELWA